MQHSPHQRAVALQVLAHNPRDGHELPIPEERVGFEVTVLLAEFATVWAELFPAEQARIVQLIVERVDVQEDKIEMRIKAEELATLVGELRKQGEGWRHDSEPTQG